jgi:hypothetical protein
MSFQIFSTSPRFTVMVNTIIMCMKIETLTLPLTYFSFSSSVYNLSVRYASSSSHFSPLFSSRPQHLSPGLIKIAWQSISLSQILTVCLSMHIPYYLIYLCKKWSYYTCILMTFYFQRDNIQTSNLIVIFRTLSSLSIFSLSISSLTSFIH